MFKNLQLGSQIVSKKLLKSRPKYFENCPGDQFLIVPKQYGTILELSFLLYGSWRGLAFCNARLIFYK